MAENKNTNIELVVKAASTLITLLLALLGFFLQKNYNQNEQTAKDVNFIKIQIAEMRSDLNHFKEDQIENKNRINKFEERGISENPADNYPWNGNKYISFNAVSVLPDKIKIGKN